ncbi:hypothetical protein CEB94_35695 [Streptomyces hawaiiensis]|uniref:Uncharacterized protein n=1 Tax=Streptomyces hawaiiensis TaxID=67305 RepID=A0A6G5RNA9_9ACTN|nr:hypothetical protein CEB94_35695 [Streptomyces hawaiiensis]
MRAPRAVRPASPRFRTAPAPPGPACRPGPKTPATPASTPAAPAPAPAAPALPTAAAAPPAPVPVPSTAPGPASVVRGQRGSPSRRLPRPPCACTCRPPLPDPPCFPDGH